ncbi:UxaA family hydrolase [Oceanidesulfovibrio marinus]|uniref:Altronate dehydratase n=1 Tax=Oceanidesulfovibrio marinus TaxID=370038 RepID=A0A6P1ZBE4_9BACT|nr:UxaA family hydrolase [Oceanidesulfovibrio marinus]TVM31235.1 altronate dehydratase [Oceanidesulfovibrio marinus]
MKIKAFRRENGRYGIRNHLLVMPTSVCAADTAARIAAQVPGAVSIPNQHGCCQISSDLLLTQKTIVGFGRNANVGAVLVVGLGCDGIQAEAAAAEVAETGKPVEHVVIQETGGTLKTISRGVELAATMARKLSTQVREECDISELIMGLECGGSDPTSGLASNPTIGYASTKLVDNGGSSILSETTEVIGAEHLLAARFADPLQREKFLRLVKAVEDRAISMGEDLRSGQPTPGNKAGGLSTIEEKSLGCMYKAGTSPFTGALDYAEEVPDAHGLYFMDTPGQDIDSITGMVAGGAQLVIFSTGRGTPTGCPIAPVIKITGNPETFEKMPDNIDINAGRIISEGATVAEIGEELFEMMIEVCNGSMPKAESLGHKEFGIYKLTGTF